LVVEKALDVRSKRRAENKGEHAMLCSLSTKLSETQMGGITALEKELGYPLLAFSCHPVAPAAITAEQLTKIQELETKLDVSLVAVEA
jgi:hypothetical protein